MIFGKAKAPTVLHRSKGLTEEELAKIGYDDFIAVRPGTFTGVDRTGTKREREKLPWIQSIIGSVAPSSDVCL